MVMSRHSCRQVTGRLDAALQRQPFAPFRIRVEGGVGFLVRRPELVTVCALQIVLASGDPALGTERVVVETSRITGIEDEPA